MAGSIVDSQALPHTGRNSSASRICFRTGSGQSKGTSAGSSHQLAHPAYAKPELLATGPRQLWNWDITKLLGAIEWTYFYLYVILDVFSRYVVGWKVAKGGERGAGETAYWGYA